jgi:hypothetical protein
VGMVPPAAAGAAPKPRERSDTRVAWGRAQGAAAAAPFGLFISCVMRRRPSGVHTAASTKGRRGPRFRFREPDDLVLGGWTPAPPPGGEEWSTSLWARRPKGATQDSPPRRAGGEAPQRSTSPSRRVPSPRAILRRPNGRRALAEGSRPPRASESEAPDNGRRALAEGSPWVRAKGRRGQASSLSERKSPSKARTSELFERAKKSEQSEDKKVRASPRGRRGMTSSQRAKKSNGPGPIADKRAL